MKVSALARRVRLPARAPRCYSAFCGIQLRIAGAIGSGGFVAGVDLCVYLLGDLRELHWFGSDCGDREPCVRAPGGWCGWRREATAPHKARLFWASPFRFRCYAERRAFASSVERYRKRDGVVLRRGSRASCEHRCVVFFGFGSSAKCNDFSATEHFHSSNLNTSFCDPSCFALLIA